MAPRSRAGFASRMFAPRVRPDLSLVCDTAQSGGPVHAGRLGGAIVDPSLVLAQVLLRMQAALPSGVAFRPLEEPCRPGGQHPGGSVIRPQSDPVIRRLADGRAAQGRALDQKITNGSALSCP